MELKRTNSLRLTISAITSRQCLEIDYPPGRRVVAPHILGRTRDDKMVLSAYQLSGASESDETEGWKTFYLDLIRMWRCVTKNFYRSQITIRAIRKLLASSRGFNQLGIGLVHRR